MAVLHTYGSKYHSSFPGSGSVPNSDKPFATVNEASVGIVASAGTVLSASQDNVANVSANDGGDKDLLFDIPDEFVPDGATAVSVILGLAERSVGAIGTPLMEFMVKTGVTKATFNLFATTPIAAFTEHVSGSRTTNADGVTLTGALFKASKWGVRLRNGSGFLDSVEWNKCVLKVTYTNPAVVAGSPLDDSKIVGTTARLGVARLGATRLGNAIRSPLLQDGANGLYDYTRSLPQAGPPNAAQDSWTEVVDPEDV